MSRIDHAWRLFRLAGTHALRAGRGRRTYAEWVKQHALTDADREGISHRIKQSLPCPRLSIIVAVSPSDAASLPDLVSSLTQQLYPMWDLYLCSSEHDPVALRESDSRIHQCVASSDDPGCLASAGLQESSSEWVVLLREACALSEHALYLIAEAIAADHDAVLLYGDEDKMSRDGERTQPLFKPEWNPDLLVASPYLGSLVAVRRSAIEAAGGITGCLGTEFIWDLSLRVGEHSSCAKRIPHVLTHVPCAPIASSGGLFPEQTPDKPDPRIQVLDACIERRGLDAEVIPDERDQPRIRYKLPCPSPRVALIIPTRDRCDLLRRCVDSILTITDYDRFSITIVDNESIDPETLAYLSSIVEDPRVSVLPHAGEFNFAAINNAAVEQVDAEIVGLLNNDLCVHSPEWLREMVVHAIRPQIGAVGAKLLYPDGRIQHAGVILGPCDLAGHSFRFCRENGGPEQERIRKVQNYSAVTAACLLVRRSLYEQMDGLDAANLPIAYNDVDFCLRLQDAGYRNLYTPYAILEHHESATRIGEDTPAKFARARREQACLRQRWKPILDDDPAYNPNLTWENERFGLAFPSRAPRPWQALPPSSGQDIAHRVGPIAVLHAMFTKAVAVGISSAVKLVAKWTDKAGVPGDLQFVNRLPEAVEASRTEPVNPEKLNLHWVIPDFMPGAGGHMAIFRIVKYLEEKGHCSTLWIRRRTMHGTGAQARACIRKDFLPLEAEVRVCTEENVDVVVGDAVIATDRWTAFYVRAIRNVNKRFYLVQDYEPLFYPMGSEALLAGQSYRMGLIPICSSRWLERKMKDAGNAVVHRFDYAVDHQIYHPRPAVERSVQRIAFYSRGHTPRRAVELGFMALEQLAKMGVPFHVDFFGCEMPRFAAQYPYTCHGVLAHEGLADLYARAAIGMVFSATNYSLIPHEMMACGLPVVDLAHESTEEAYPPEAIALATPEPRCIAETLKMLLTDADHRDRVRAAALDYVRPMRWERSAQQVEEALLAGLGESLS